MVGAVVDLAARQHGAVSVKQLRAIGVTARRQRAVLASGWLREDGHGVLVMGGAPDTWHQRLSVGLLALGDEAWVSHDAAAALHGLDRAVQAVEFTVPRHARRSSPPLGTHTTDVVGRLAVVEVAGFRCASATRTILDLAYVGTPTVRLEAAIDSAVRLGLSAPHVIEARLADLRGPGRHGARALDRLLVDSGGETVSSGCSSSSFAAPGCLVPSPSAWCARTAGTWRGWTSCSSRGASWSR